MEGHITIVDFGLSKIEMYNGDKTETFCGSLEYMPPELLAGIIDFGESQTPRTPLYQRNRLLGSSDDGV